MSDSILTTTKKVLGIEEDYVDFDVDVILHINSVFSTLNQLGIGTDDGFMILDASPTWVDFFGPDPRLNAVKSYVFLRVKLLFDPPGTSFLINAYQQQIQEMEWRLAEIASMISKEVPAGFGASPFGAAPFGV